MENNSTAETRAELKRLEEFACTLRKGSVVHFKVTILISSIAKDLTVLEEATKNEVWTLKLQVTVGAAVGLRNISVNKTSTLQDIKTLVENQPQAVTVDRIKVKRTGRAWAQFDVRSLVELDIVNGDELLIDCTAKAQKQFDKTITGLARIENCDVKLNASSDLLLAAVHCFVLDQGFTCVMELPSTVPGFAPSLKELPPGVLLPSDWKSVPNKYRLLYKHKAKPVKQFVLQAVIVGESDVELSLGAKNATAPSVVRLSVPHFIGSDVPPPEDSQYFEVMYIKFLAVEELTELVVSLVRKTVPDLPSTTTSSSSVVAMEVVQQQQAPLFGATTTTLNPPMARPQYPPQPIPGNAAHPPVHGSGSSSGSSSVPPPQGPSFNAGRANLDPFPTVVITPGGGVAAPSLVVPGAGSLVGPDHPLFNGGGGGGYGEDGYGFDYGGSGDPNAYFFPGSAGGLGGGGGAGGLGLPQPRFDPFGPVVGPNSGVNVGNPGGRFGGRGGRGRPAPGEPNPDHMKPPG